MNIRSRRLAALMTVTALGTGASVVAAPAQASLLGGLLPGQGSAQGSLLGGLLPNLGTILTGTGLALGNTVNGLLPGVGGVVTGVTGTVGGVVGGVQQSVTGVLDHTLGGVLDQTLGGVVGGVTGDLLPNNVLNSLLGTLLANSTAAPGSLGTGTSGGPIVLAGGSITPHGVVVDASAPRPTVKVLTKLKEIGASGRMLLQISTNEPGIVAVAGSVRPGLAVKTKAKKAVKHSRRLINVPSVVLGYRAAGKLVVTVKLSRTAQRTLGKSKDARVSIGTLASDVFKNQGSDNIRLRLTR